MRILSSLVLNKPRTFSWGNRFIAEEREAGGNFPSVHLNAIIYTHTHTPLQQQLQQLHCASHKGMNIENSYFEFETVTRPICSRAAKTREVDRNENDLG